MATNKKNIIGGWAFIGGIVVAILISLFGVINPGMLWFLVIIGLIVGMINVSEEESTPFMMSGAVLIIASAFGQGVMDISPLMGKTLDSLLLIFVPATIVVAAKNVFTMARH